MRRLYFGYGSNLDDLDFEAFVERRGFRGARLRAGMPAILPDHAPAYRYRSAARGGGALDVRPVRGAVTPGVLFEADERTLTAIDAKEGVEARCYERVETWALDLDGNEHPCVTYRVCEDRLREFTPPREDYARVVTRGLARHGLPATWHELAARGGPPRPLPVFVYGTLRRGEPAAHRLPREGRLGVEEARARGRLLHLGAYPGLVPGEAWVEGELHRFECLEAALPELDEYEDFAGFGRPESLYRRVVGEVATAVGRELAWIYRYLGAEGGHPEIEGGDWRAARTALSGGRGRCVGPEGGGLDDAPRGDHSEHR